MAKKKKTPEQIALEQINKKLLKRYLEIDKSGELVNKPKDDDELDEFIQLAFNTRLPRKVIDPAHSSPFSFVADCFFERTKNALAFANRSGGKTYAVSILNMLDMLFKPGCEIASAGAIQAQAKKAYTYFMGFTQMEWFREFAADYEAKTGRKFLTKDNQEETTFITGSKQEILTATEKGLRSPHPHKARIDEVDEIPWSILQTGLSMARSDDEIRGQNVFTSTRQHAAGSMQTLLDKAAKNGSIKVYQWNIWEAVEKCKRRCFDDPKHGTCPIYAYCQGKAHRCDGFYKIEDFIDKVCLIDKEKFEVEWENKKPSRNKLVYAEFDEAKHIMTPERLHKMTGYYKVPSYWHRVGGIDFGASPGHPFVYLCAAQMPATGAWILFHEYVQEQRLMRDHANAIKDSPLFTPGDVRFADSAGKQERMELRALGVPTKEANKDVQMGIDLVRTMLAGTPPSFEPQLYVWHTCEFTIDEFNLYSWPTRLDGKPDKTGNPQKLNDHAMDAIRYMFLSQKTNRRGSYRARRETV